MEAKKTKFAISPLAMGLAYAIELALKQDERAKRLKERPAPHDCKEAGCSRDCAESLA